MNDEINSGQPVTLDQINSVAPALAHHTEARLYGEVWQNPDLNKRDRCLITLAAMIVRGQVFGLTHYIGLALDHGVTPAEISETITHLAYYTGWGNAIVAIGPASRVFAQRGIGADQLPQDAGPKLPLDEAAEAKRAANVSAQFGAVAPALVQYTTDYLFQDLWLRPGLAPRDRSLVTVAALITAGQVAQITFHLNRAMDNCLTQAQAAAVITHLAFYAGWPNAMSALSVAKEIFAQRAAGV